MDLELSERPAIQVLGDELYCRPLASATCNSISSLLTTYGCQGFQTSGARSGTRVSRAVPPPLYPPGSWGHWFLLEDAGHRASRMDRFTSLRDAALRASVGCSKRLLREGLQQRQWAALQLATCWLQSTSEYCACAARRERDRREMRPLEGPRGTLSPG